MKLLILLLPMLYSIILQTDYEIVERHSQGVIPAYLEPGIKADTDLQSTKNIKFVSNNHTAVLKVSLKDSNLLVELYSLPNGIDGEYEVRNSQVVDPRTIYRYSSDLKPGEGYTDPRRYSWPGSIIRLSYSFG